MNSDGINDIVISASGYSSYTGRVYVVYGVSGTSRPTFSLTSLSSTTGFVITGEVTSGRLGRSLRVAGDVNNDGIKDMIIGGHMITLNSKTNVGAAYVIYGY